MDILNYDRKAELRKFDETKIGVKGLVDAGITEVPRIFRLSTPETLNYEQEFSLPVIDLKGINEDPIRRKQAVDEVKDALGSWGFFQIVNHGIPVSIMDDVRKGVIRFFEQDSEVKKQLYTRDRSKGRVTYTSNFDLYTAPVTNWRDSLLCTMYPNPPNPEELPEPCRDILLEYSNHVMKLGCSISELMSEALGLAPNYLQDIGAVEELLVAGYYYPQCPQPELAIGTSEHTDASFFTILLQDHIGGLKIFYKNQWTNVTPIAGGLIVNIGDILQLVSNDNFVSVRHKVMVNKVSPRTSVSSFFGANVTAPTLKVLEPIKELLSKDDPAKYRSTTAKEYLDYFFTGGLENRALYHFKI